MYVSAAEITIRLITSIKLDKGVEFSNGCALFALKNPPPFVPSNFIAVCDAAGPSGIIWPIPSTVLMFAYCEKF